MFHDLETGLLFPAWRQVSELVQALDRLPAWVDQVVVVRDGTARGGPGEWSALTRDPRVRVLAHPRPQGVGAAAATGYRALAALGVDAVVLSPPCAPLDPGDLPALLAPLVRRRADLVSGWRPLSASGDPGRRLLLGLGGWLAGRVLGSSAARCRPHAVSVDALRALALGELARGPAFFLDLQLQAHGAGLVVHTVRLESPATRVPPLVPEGLWQVAARAAARRLWAPAPVRLSPARRARGFLEVLPGPVALPAAPAPRDPA